MALGRRGAGEEQEEEVETPCRYKNTSSGVGPPTPVYIHGPCMSYGTEHLPGYINSLTHPLHRTRPALNLAAQN
jgi:hypothetical protein